MKEVIYYFVEPKGKNIYLFLWVIHKILKNKIMEKSYAL